MDKLNTRKSVTARINPILLSTSIFLSNLVNAKWHIHHTYSVLDVLYDMKSMLNGSDFIRTPGSILIPSLKLEVDWIYFPKKNGVSTLKLAINFYLISFSPM